MGTNRTRRRSVAKSAKLFAQRRRRTVLALALFVLES